MTTTKAFLRKIYLEKRLKLSPEEVLERSKLLLEQFQRLDFSDKTYFHIFLPILSRNEVNTWFFVEYLHSLGKKVVVSQSDIQKGTMNHFVVTAETQFQENAWGIPEPVHAESIDVQKIEVVIVPLLVSDKQMNRVGYGKGFYDKFLSECRLGVLKIGLSFFSPIDKIQDTTPLDIPLDKVLFVS